jgi:two-component system alkaline phosphatase synthesis response regulator PhoP
MNPALKEPKETILIIEDETEIAEMIQTHLADEGFETRVCFDPRKGLQAASDRAPSLILLDVIMPGMSGIEVCQQLKERESTKEIPIIFLTGQGAEKDIVSGLELGADDYVTKPFSYNLLVARIRAVLRRTHTKQEPAPERAVVGPIVIDFPKHEVTADGVVIALTLAEFQLLGALVRNPGRVLARNNLLQEISREGEPIIERNVDVHIGTLRRKLGQHGGLIVTVRGIGYKIQD